MKVLKIRKLNFEMFENDYRLAFGVYDEMKIQSGAFLRSTGQKLALLITNQ